MEKGFGTGERDWSTQDKEKLLSILETDGFDGDFANLAAKLPNQTVDSIRYLITQCEEDREKPNWEVILDSKIEELRGMEGPTFSENLALFTFHLAHTKELMFKTQKCPYFIYIVEPTASFFAYRIIGFHSINTFGARRMFPSFSPFTIRNVNTAHLGS